MFKIITRTTVIYMIMNDVMLRINHTPVKVTIHYSEAVWFSDIWFTMNKILFITTATNHYTKVTGAPLLTHTWPMYMKTCCYTDIKLWNVFQVSHWVA